MKLLRRLIVCLLILTASVILLFGPRSGAGLPTDRVIVTYWEKWTGNEATQMKQIVNDFNNSVGKDKGIYVHYLSISDVNKKTLISTAAGDPPDLAGLWDNNIVQFAASDALEPLENYANSRNITSGKYKKVYWDACVYENHLWALPTTPMATALLWNKRIFHEKAKELKAAGLDPDRAPRTLEEFDQYCRAIDTFKTFPDGSKRIALAGHIPMEPGWYMNEMPYYFGGDVADVANNRLTFLSPPCLEAFNWIRSYSQRLGTDMVSDFRSGFGSFNSAQNAFITHEVAMVLQGPWMANYIEDLAPSMNRVKWTKEEERKLPRERRKENYEWGFAPFPAAHGLQNVSYCALDVLCIPKTAKHKKEAFEFIAYVSRQDVMEKLCMLHCKNSPLASVSQNYLENHPNPYIEIFDTLAAAPNAHGTPQIPVYPQVEQELTNAVERIFLQQSSTDDALRQAQDRAQAKWNQFSSIQVQRKSKAAALASK
jgi:multiple sugar transport system substrate-binding protein